MWVLAWAYGTSVGVTVVAAPLPVLFGGDRTGIVTGAPTVAIAGVAGGVGIKLGTGDGIGVMTGVGTGDGVGEGTAVGVCVTVGDGNRCGMLGTCGTFGTCGTDVGNMLFGTA